MKFIIANGDQNAEKVPGAHQEEVEFFSRGSNVPYRKNIVWVADLTAEQLVEICRRSGGYIAIDDRSVKGEHISNSLGAPYLQINF